MDRGGVGLPSFEDVASRLRAVDRAVALRLGDSGPDVSLAQQALNALGMDVPSSAGRFDQAMHDAVVAFQAGAGLHSDGILGPLTRAKLLAGLQQVAQPASAAGPSEGRTLRQVALPNGIELVVRLGAALAGDVVVCSSDWHGTPGALNSHVLSAVGADAAALPSAFKPPFTLLRAPRGRVLVVATIGPRTAKGAPHSFGLTARSLYAGLSEVLQSSDVATIALPLIGTGSAGLSPLQSSAACLRTLSRLARPASGRATVSLCIQGDSLSPGLARWIDEGAFDGKVLHVDSSELALHVRSALLRAFEIADGQPISAAHVLRAAVELAPKADSLAFTFTAKLLPLAPAAPPVIRPGSDLLSLHATPGFLSAFNRYLDRWLGESQPIFGRDLITIALLSSDRDALEALAAEAGTSLAALRSAWREFVIKEGIAREPSEWEAWWRDADLVADGAARPGYFADAVRGADLLGIEDESEAFARLILDEAVTPPLSIGLLGHWGSGKSFFLKEIRAKIDVLKAGPGMCEHVLSVEFNAWHAADTNLWASLVSHLFDQVWGYIAPVDTPERARSELRAEISQAQGAVQLAERQVADARSAVEQRIRDRDGKLEVLALRKLVKDSVEPLRVAAERAGWSEPLEAIIDVQSAVEKLRSNAERMQLAARTLLEHPPVRKLALWAGLALLIVVGALLVAHRFAHDAEIQSGIKLVGYLAAAVTSALGSIVGVLREANRRIAGFHDALLKVRDDYERELSTLAEQRDPGQAREIRAARAEMESAESGLSAARERLACVLAQHEALDPVRRLNAFLEEVTRAGTYANQQGIVSLVRRDFQKLAERLRDYRANPSAMPDGLRPIDRIVLYVDDLDRCSPAQVVRMLEAVHLLLSLDLFVVVVAVDCRWLLRSLELHYKELLGDGGHGAGEHLGSTPHDYLEKIFQITYALAPMDRDGFDRYIEGIAGDTAPRLPLVRSVAAAPSPASAPSPSGGDGRPGTTPQLPEQQPRVPARSAPTDARAAQVASAADAERPSLRSIQIGGRERLVMKRLLPLVHTPRSAKRLVNTYRLIKASLRDDELRSFEDFERGQFRPTLLLLAVLFGRPEQALLVFEKLCAFEAPFATPSEPFHEALRELPADGYRELAEAAAAADIELSVEDARRAARRVARYSLVTGTSFHSW